MKTFNGLKKLCGIILIVTYVWIRRAEQHEATDGKSKGNGGTTAASFEGTIESLDTRFTDVLIRLLDRICDLGCDNNNEKLLNVLCR